MVVSVVMAVVVIVVVMVHRAPSFRPDGAEAEIVWRYGACAAR
jgi:hypothetical protein